VYVGEQKYRRKFYAAVPLDEIPSEAIRSLIYSVSDEPDPNEGMMPLFDVPSAPGRGHTT
jgi:hypothetical protein